MSVALRNERLWLYAPSEEVSDTGTVSPTTHALVEMDTADFAVWAAFAPQAGREDTVALRRTAIARAVFTLADAVEVTESYLCRLVRTGTLYTVTGLRVLPTARERLVDASSVERGTYSITADVPAYTVASVTVTGPATLSVGTARRYRATLVSATGTTLTDRPVQWASSNPAAVYLDAQGRAEAMAPGMATLTADVGGLSDGTLVTVS